MCEDYTPCCPKRCRRKEKFKKFNVLLLDCWQREYDKRPYKHFKFKVLDFEQRMNRPFNHIKDFNVIIEFLYNRKLHSVSIVGMNATTKLEVELDFADSLKNVLSLELRLMKLPDIFFDKLLSNVDQMYLQELILEGTQLSYAKIQDLRFYLIEAKHLHYLNVNFCSIDQSNFAFLADGVHKSPSMRRFEFARLLGGTLSLDDSKIAHTISSLIWQNKLEVINMQHCEIFAQEMEYISEYLWSKCSKLQKLNVSCNPIDSDGAQYLFAALSHSGTLTHLNLCRCRLGAHGADVVAKYFSSCLRLKLLDIRYNDIPAENMNNILTMLKKKIKEHSLKFFGNHFDAKSGAIINRLLKSRVVPQDSIDVTVTFDEDLGYHRIVPY